jgi:ABC-type oligopeptide transport system substrate-binding subunit
MYEGLTVSSPNGEVTPATATSWQIEEGGRVYVFNLRRNARWSNGEAVKAADFVAGFRRAVDPATVSGAADLLRSIENAPAILRGEVPSEQLGVRALDDHTLEIRLSNPLPYFPDILTNTVASPVHRSSLESDRGFANAGVTVSNGPYVLAELTPGTGLKLKKNPHYWDRSSVAYDEIRYAFIADENSEFIVQVPDCSIEQRWRRSTFH